MKKFLPLIFIVCLSLVAFQCDEDDITPLTQEEEQTALNILKSEIENLADTSICNDTTECQFIGLGSKPCGGPWSYLTYSTSIDTEKLESLVDTYNQKEKDFNTTWRIASDCALVNPPTSVQCENNICVAVY
ncbi:MAG: hypothetical protein ABJL44_11300 [Algibacter sp.]